MAAQSLDELPRGAHVENIKPAPIPTKKSYAGEFVKNRNRDTTWFAMTDKDWNSSFTQHNYRSQELHLT